MLFKDARKKLEHCCGTISLQGLQTGPRQTKGRKRSGQPGQGGNLDAYSVTHKPLPNLLHQTFTNLRTQELPPKVKFTNFIHRTQSKPHSVDLRGSMGEEVYCPSSLPGSQPACLPISNASTLLPAQLYLHTNNCVQPLHPYFGVEW